ncbi:MAG: DNA gyrase C-terminal beta-propeller domain-containing protein [Candidatus Latescibacterota bacterium]|nr:DNA gyrase C-terminal beta-propeller domain-containing protein [Candidatus Latescibacterota bacterium]
MIVTQDGVLIRTEVGGISTVGRNTQGVRVINLGDGDRVIDMTRVPKSDDEPEVDEAVSEEGEGAANGASEGAAEGVQTPSGESE